MAGKFFVVQGAICTCQYGTTPDQLEVTSNEKDYINDSNGKMKPIGSTKDIGQPFKAKTFGYCNKNRSSCAVNVTTWKDFYENVTLANNGKILTEKSKATCAVGAPDCIRFDFHGQTTGMSPDQAAAANDAAMAVLNPMAPKPLAAKKELPKVKQIKVTLPARTKDNTRHSKRKEEKNIASYTARINEDMQFEVVEYWNKAKADTEKVSWKVIKAHAYDGEGETLKEIGPAFSVSFDIPGNYRVLAFGSDSSQKDDMCCFDITVKYNSIKAIGFDALTARALPGGGEHRIRRGVAATLEALYEMEPTAEERQLVHMEVSDKQGNIICITGKGEDSVGFTPENSAATYTVSAIMTPADGAEQRVTRTFNTEANSVTEVTCEQGEKVRVNTDMTFQAKMRYNSLSLESFEKAAIKWQLDGREVGTGPTLTLSGTTYFSRPGRHVVEAYVVSNNAWSVNSKGKQTGVNEKDDWRFEVKYNEVLEVSGPTQLIVGKKYNFEAKLAFGDYNKVVDGPIIWKTPGGTGTFSGATCNGVYAPTAMNSLVGATLRNSSKELKITADMAGIERWCFTDAEKVYKSKAGWSEKIQALIKSSAAAGTQIHLHLIEDDKGRDFNYIRDLGTVSFDEEGLAAIVIDTNEIKSKLRELKFEGDYYDLFFAAEKEARGIQFANVKELEVQGKKMVFPSSQSNQSSAETGKYIYISSKESIVDVRYLNDSGERIYKVLNYGEKVRMHVQTMNLAGKKIKLSIYFNIPRGEDALVMGDKEFIVRQDETLRINIDTNVLKNKVAKADHKKIAMFYVVLKEADGDRYMYPDDLSLSQTLNTTKVNFYHHLKLSENTEHINKLARDNAPVVLGEPLEGLNKQTGVCLCQNYDLIWGKKVSCEFRKKVVEICAALWGEDRKIEMANGLMAVINVETGGSFKAHQIMGKKLKPVDSVTKDDFAQKNKEGKIVSSRAVGLIQFTQAALTALGEFTSGSGYDKLHEVKLRFAQMGEIKQLDYVKKYFELDKANERIKTPGDIYLHVFAPAGVGQKDDFILYDSGSDYTENKSVDTNGNKDGKIQRSEILSRYNTSKAQGEGNKAVIKRCVNDLKYNATGVITYRIYWNGVIEKHLPKKIKEGLEDKYKYVYHDKDNGEHELGTFVYYKTKEMDPGNRQGDDDVELLDARQFKGYSSDKVKLKFQTWNSDSQRWYINPDCFAGLLGAMGALNIDYLGFNGFSDNKAQSVGGSSSHRNGVKGDLRYLSTNKNGEATLLQSPHFDYDMQVKFNNELFNFGWGILEDMYSEKFTKDKKEVLLPHTKHMRKDGPKGYRHHHHLHLSGFDTSTVIKIKE